MTERLTDYSGQEYEESLPCFFPIPKYYASRDKPSFYPNPGVFFVPIRTKINFTLPYNLFKLMVPTLKIKRGECWIVDSDGLTVAAERIDYG